MLSRPFALLLFILLPLAALAGCTDRCLRNSDCAQGMICSAAKCVVAPSSDLAGVDMDHLTPDAFATAALVDLAGSAVDQAVPMDMAAPADLGPGN